MSWYNQKPIHRVVISKDVPVNSPEYILALKNGKEWANKHFGDCLPNCVRIESGFPDIKENGDHVYEFYIEEKEE